MPPMPWEGLVHPLAPIDPGHACTACGHGIAAATKAALPGPQLPQFPLDRAKVIADLKAELAKSPLRDKLEIAIDKVRSGVPLSKDDHAELQRLSEMSNKGYITAQAGAALTLRSADGTYQKYGGELNSDRGAVGTGEMGYERGFGMTKVKMAGKGDTEGGSNVSGSGEQDIWREGPARIKAGYEANSNGSQAVSLKGALEQDFSVPGFGSAKPEAYLKISANKLNETEALAIEARGTENAAQFAEATAQRRAALEQFAQRRGERLGE